MSSKCPVISIGTAFLRNRRWLDEGGNEQLMKFGRKWGSLFPILLSNGDEEKQIGGMASGESSYPTIRVWIPLKSTYSLPISVKEISLKKWNKNEKEVRFVYQSKSSYAGQRIVLFITNKKVALTLMCWKCWNWGFVHLDNFYIKRFFLFKLDHFDYNLSFSVNTNVLV